MKDQIKLIKNALRTSFAMLVAVLLFSGGLFLNLSAVGATGDSSPTPTPTPSPTVSPTASPTASPSVSPSPSPEAINPPSFPKCIDQSGTGDKAHYESGFHQIVGNGLLEGKDDVYSLSDGNFLQCYVPPLKDVCIQTNWWRTDQVLAGWYSVNGSQWNLGNYHYLAKNINYNCNPEPSPTPTPVVTPTPTTNTGSNEQHQEQTQNNNQTVTINTGSVAGVKTPTRAPETGVGVLGLAGMFSAAPIGLVLSRLGKGRMGIKKEEDIGEMAMSIARNRTIKK